MKYTVELSSGKVFSGLELSGDCFVSSSEVRAEEFTGGLRLVKVKGEPEREEESGMGYEYELECPKLGGVKAMLGGWYFWFEASSAEARAAAKAQADVEYVAMMTGVEL